MKNCPLDKDAETCPKLEALDLQWETANNVIMACCEKCKEESVRCP